MQNEPSRLNTNQINRVTSGLIDIQISRHPLSYEITIIFNKVEVDIYHDTTSFEEYRINKLAVVRTDRDAEYIQQLFPDDILVDDEDHRVPYVVTMTLTGLKRKPKVGDYIIYKDTQFTVSKVKPLNEKVDEVLTLLMYPSRDETYSAPIDLKLLDVFLYDLNLNPIESLQGHVGEDLIADVVYDGDPRRYSFDGENWTELTMNRIKFNAYSPDMVLYIQDADENVSDFRLP